MPLYHSDRGLYDFQALGVAYCYERQDNLAVWDTGIGKTHLAMATAALLFEDDRIDTVLVVCEKNKLDEWVADFAEFTELRTVKYHGDPKRRARLRADDTIQVYVSTYETVRNDAATKRPGPRSRTWDPGVLTETLRGRRVLVAYDEVTKLGGRGSGNHRSHATLLKELRKAGEVKALGLTATPIERDVEGFYNLGRIVAPYLVPTVAQFEADYVKARDIFDNVAAWKNLTPDDCEPGVTPFSTLLKPVILRKRKTDPDVVDQFPKTVEEFTYVKLDKDHKAFYDTVREVFEDAPEMTQKVLFTTMRQIAGHPLALLQSKAKVAQTIVENVGEAGLKALGSAKTDRLVEYLLPLIKGQGAQAVVFSFFGPSILPRLAEALAAEGITSGMNHGQLPDRERAENKARFRAGQLDVFLTSDAGARGINLPEATYAVEYELALTHALRLQRLNRINRINSTHASVTFQSFIAVDTVEEGIAGGVLKRNEWSDLLLDDDDPGEDFISAAMRRRVMQVSKRKALSASA